MPETANPFFLNISTRYRPSLFLVPHSNRPMLASSTGSTTPMLALTSPATYSIVWSSPRAAIPSTSSLKSLLFFLRPTRVGSVDVDDAYHLLVAHHSYGNDPPLSYLYSYHHLLADLHIHYDTSTTSVSSSILYPSAIFRALCPLHFVSCTHYFPLPFLRHSLLPTPFPPSSPRSGFPSGFRKRVVSGWTPSPVLVIYRRCREVPRTVTPGAVSLSQSKVAGKIVWDLHSRCSAASAALQRGLTSYTCSFLLRTFSGQTIDPHLSGFLQLNFPSPRCITCQS